MVLIMLFKTSSVVKSTTQLSGNCIPIAIGTVLNLIEFAIQIYIIALRGHARLVRNNQMKLSATDVMMDNCKLSPDSYRDSERNCKF
jgi:hypothetical protein